MAQIAYGVSVQIPNGPQVAQTGTKAAEAYDKVELALDAGGAGAAEAVIEIQPAAAAAVSLLLVKSSIYGPEITYKLSDGTNDSPAVALDAPLFLLGGAVALAGVAPKRLKIKNTFAAGDATKKAAIEILVGRDATP
ncbi:MAG: hypothetical protein U1E63_15620 [Burkholderiales bacterium]|nr:hypothetical protein [Betaproteobacteria bacterium]